MTIKLPIKRLTLPADIPLPSYATEGDAGLDLRSAVDLTIAPGQTQLVNTGIAMAIPEGHVGLVHPRSGLAAKHGLTVLNAPGTIDSGYRGEVKVILHNTSEHTFSVSAGDRIAQLVIQEYVTAELTEVEELPTSDRGVGGFGSTGVSS